MSATTTMISSESKLLLRNPGVVLRTAVCRWRRPWYSARSPVPTSCPTNWAA